MTTKISGSNISSIANTGITWNAVTVADGSTQLNASAGNGYLLDTNTGVIEVLLPASPTRGDTVVLADYSGTFALNKVIVNTGGALIDSTEGGPGSSNDFELTTNNQVVELVYVDSAKGWLVKTNSTSSGLSSVLGGGGYADAYITATGGTITTSGDYKIHTFTGDGCFTVSQGAGPIAVVDYLVVAGAGGGGGDGGGGGGAGGFRVSNSYALPAPTMSPLSNPTGLQLSVQNYPVTVGGGGTAGGYSPAAQGTAGSNSVFSTITSAGGGQGASGQFGTCIAQGVPGGSGSGGTRAGLGGTGNTPPVSPPQGNSGAPGGPSPSGDGGGGAGAVGQNANGGPGADGGVGSYVSPSFAVGCAGTTGPVCGVRYFSGGGGGGADGTGTGGNGGAGGGAIGGARPAPSPNGGCGTANTGGGGGGAGVPNNAGAGGKGIVIIRYKFQ